MASEPMSDARLREIRKGIEFNQMGLDEDEALWAISDLLAEVARLRAREAALEAEREQWRGVVEIMAKGPISWHPEYGHICTCCDAAWIDGDPDDDQPGAIQHTSDCAVVQARALLAATEQPHAGGGDGDGL